jgi:hypothetical protein
MDKLIDYVCDELDELEKKAAKGKLSAAEVQYGDVLAHFKKNLLTADAMEEGYSNTYYRDDEPSNGSYRGSSYARGRGTNARRDSMGRYSSRGYSRRYSRGYSEAVDDMVGQLQTMMDEAPNDEMRKEIQRLMDKMQSM